MNSMTENRLKRLNITPELLVIFFIQGNTWNCHKSEIPEDAQFRGISHDYNSNTWNIFISHESFEPVPENTPVPLVGPVEFRKLILGDVIDEKN